METLRLPGQIEDRLASVLDELHDFVRHECEAQRAKFRRAWKRPMEERVERGDCIAGLSLEKILERRILRFQTDSNNSDFREGDRVRISHSDPMAPICDAEFFREELGFVEVILNAPGDWKPLEHNTVFTMDRSFIDLEPLYSRALERLGSTEVGRSRILPLLASEKTPLQDVEEFERVCAESEARKLNESQAEATAAAASTDLCHLIQGPPGTGKTHVLAEIVRQRVAKGERILVTSFTHRAIHNALTKILEHSPEIDVCKVGRPVHDPDLRIQQRENFWDTPFAQSGGAYVIGATPFAAQGSRLQNVEFDTVIFDEAGQITLPLAIMGMLSGKTYIFVGDHKQLPPILHTTDRAEGENHSIFKYLSGRGFETVLNVTYRMNEAITRWPSEQFYLGDLASHPDIAHRKIQYPGRGKEWEEILDPDCPVVFIEVPEGLDKKHSAEETILISRLIEELVCARQLSAAQIGVVVPFRRQARSIRERLKHSRNLQGRCSGIVVDTVERMQGQERDLIIVGLTASDPDFIASVGSFLFQPNRLNVSMTRAKSKLVVVGSSNLLSEPAGSVDSAELGEGRELLRGFAAGAKRINWAELASQPLQSQRSSSYSITNG